MPKLGNRFTAILSFSRYFQKEFSGPPRKMTEEVAP